MNVMVGDARFENVAVRMSDVKLREAQQADNQSAAQVIEEQEKKAASDGVVLEISEVGVGASNAEKTQADQVEQIAAQKQQEKVNEAFRNQAAGEVNLAAEAQRKMLENFNI